MEFRTLKDGRVIPIANPTSSNSHSENRPVPQKPKNYQGYRNREAFTIPNYTCKSCGASVFYYEHPNGAKVLFDQLGPPWPKHPCYEPKLSIPTSAEDKIAASTQHWQPLLISRVVRLQTGGLRIEARIKRGKLRFELDAAQVKKLDIDEYTCKDALAMAQREPRSTLAKIALHTGVNQLEVVSTRLEWLSEQENNNLPDNAKPSELELANPFAKPLATIIKPVKEKSHPAEKKEIPILRLKPNRTSQTKTKQKGQVITQLFLEQLSHDYYLVHGTHNQQRMVFGLDIKFPNNPNVLSYLITNPDGILLVPSAKADDKNFSLKHENRTFGKLELNPDITVYKAKSGHGQAKDIASSQSSPAENPFRNPVLSASLLNELKAKFRLR